MRSYGRMLIFVAVLGAVTSVIFMGMEAWTAPLIAANAEIELRSTILDANGIPHTTATVNEVFEANIAIHRSPDSSLTIYIDRNSGSVSYEFSGSGVWGPIIGIITLESDHTTIRHIRVLQQEETPGLGGVVAEWSYLAGYIGVRMTPELTFAAAGTPRQPNQVDAITGATRTSNAFLGILNGSYNEHLEFIRKAGD